MISEFPSYSQSDYLYTVSCRSVLRCMCTLQDLNLYYRSSCISVLCYSIFTEVLPIELSVPRVIRTYQRLLHMHIVCFLYSAMIQLFIRMRWCHPPEKVLILGRQKLILIPSQVDVERKVGLVTYILAVTCKSSMLNVHSSFSKLLASYYWSSSAYLKCFFNKSFLLYVSKMGYLILKQILCLFLNLF